MGTTLWEAVKMRDAKQADPASFGLDFTQSPMSTVIFDYVPAEGIDAALAIEQQGRSIALAQIVD